nr:hypothetical protein [uncultured Desulfuromonas sp.]
MRLKRKYEILKQNESVEKRISNVLSDPTKVICKPIDRSVSDAMLRNCEIDDDILQLVESRLGKEKNNVNKNVLSLWSKVLKRKLSETNFTNRIFLTSCEIILIAALGSGSEAQKSVLLTKAKMLMGYGSTLKEQDESSRYDQLLNESITAPDIATNIPIPAHLNDLELAKMLRGRLAMAASVDPADRNAELNDVLQGIYKCYAVEEINQDELEVLKIAEKYVQSLM